MTDKSINRNPDSHVAKARVSKLVFYLLLLGSIFSCILLWQTAHATRIELERARSEGAKKHLEGESAHKAGEKAHLDLKQAIENNNFLTANLTKSNATIERLKYASHIKTAYEAACGKRIEATMLNLQLTRPEFRGWEYNHVLRVANLEEAPSGFLWGVAVPRAAELTTLPHTYSITTGRINDAKFSPDGLALLTANTDGKARVWNVSTGKMLSAIEAHRHGVNQIAWNQNGSMILTAGLDGEDYTARVWDAATGKLRIKLSVDSDQYPSFSPDGSKLMIVSQYLGEPGQLFRQLQIYDCATGQLDSSTGLENKFAARSASFIPAQPMYLVRGSSAGLLTGDCLAVFDRATNKQIAILDKPSSNRCKPFFTHDGLKVLTYGQMTDPATWDISKDIPDLSGGLRFRPGATISDLVSGKIITSFAGHTSTLSSAEFSPDETRVVTASDFSDQTIRLWDARSGAELLLLPGRRFASFSPDGNRIVTTLDSTSVTIYEGRRVDQSHLDIAPPPRQKP